MKLGKIKITGNETGKIEDWTLGKKTGRRNRLCISQVCGGSNIKQYNIKIIIYQSEINRVASSIKFRI